MTTTNRTEHFLSFDGVDDYVQARDASVYEDLTFPYKFRIRPENTSFTLFSKGVFGPTTHDYNANLVSGQFGYYNRVNGDNHDYRFSYSPTLGVDLEYEIDLDSGDLVQRVDGVEQRRDVNPALVSDTNNLLFTIGRSPTKDTALPYRYFQGRIYSFQIGTETFPMNEGTGTTITGSEGTVLDIYGATWGSQII